MVTKMTDRRFIAHSLEEASTFQETIAWRSDSQQAESRGSRAHHVMLCYPLSNHGEEGAVRGKVML